LSRNTLKTAIRSLIEKGFIERTQGENCSYFYVLRMKGGHKLATLNSKGGSKIDPKGGQKLTPLYKKETGNKLIGAESEIRTPKNKKLEPTKFDHKAAIELRKVISSVVAVNGRFDKKKWANVFRLMRTRDKIPKGDIRDMIRWYADHIGGQYDVQAFSANSFRDKWEKLVAAKMRDKGNSAGIENKKKKIAASRNVRQWLADQGKMKMFDVVYEDMVEEALEALGLEPGFITARFINSEGENE
jgi:DNA-binding MarR family transcriptional regulator